MMPLNASLDGQWPSTWFGRNEEFAQAYDYLSGWSGGPRSLGVHGVRGVGKSAFLGELAKSLSERDFAVIAVRASATYSVAERIAEWLERREPSGSRFWTGSVEATVAERAISEFQPEKPLVFIVDELDAVSRGDTNDLFDNLLNAAENHGRYFQFIGAGSGLRWRASLTGPVSWTIDAFRIVTLSRLNQADSMALLRDSIKADGALTTPEDQQLERLVGPARGVPRLLHAAGQQFVLSSRSGLSVEAAMSSAVEQLRHQKVVRSAISFGANEETQAAFRFLEGEIPPGEGADLDSLIRKSWQSGPANFTEGLDQLLLMGFYELRGDWVWASE